MRKVNLALGCLVAVFLAFETGIALADIVIAASAVTCVPEAWPDHTDSGWQDYANVGKWIGSENGKVRDMAIEFDVSGVAEPITGAYLKLYSDSYSGNTSAITQTANLLSPSGISPLNWDTMLATKTQTPLESFGYFSATSGALDTWYDTQVASSADVSALEVLRIGSGKITVLLSPTGSVGEVREYGATGAYLPQLVLNSVPEPSTVTLLVMGLIGLLCYAWKKRRS
jgi:hypothetical protein